MCSIRVVHIIEQNSNRVGPLEAKACGHAVITRIEEDGRFSIQLICFVDRFFDESDWLAL